MSPAARWTVRVLVAAGLAWLSWAVIGSAMAQEPGPPLDHVWSAWDAAIAAAGGLSVLFSAAIGWHTLREKRRASERAEQAPIRAIGQGLDAERARVDRLYAAVGLRDDDRPLRERVDAVEAAVDEIRRVQGAQSVVMARIEDQSAAILREIAALAAGRTP